MKFWNSDDQVNRTLIVAILWRLARILTGESLIVVAVSNHGPPWTGTVIQIRPPREMIVACLYLFMIRFVFSQSKPFLFFVLRIVYNHRYNFVINTLLRIQEPEEKYLIDWPNSCTIRNTRSFSVEWKNLKFKFKQQFEGKEESRFDSKISNSTNIKGSLLWSNKSIP